MQAVQTNGEALYISREKLTTLVNQIFGGANSNPNPDEPFKPGPWDHVIRKVAKEFFGPQPEPWRSEFKLNKIILGIIAARNPEIFDVIDGRFTRAELNPQPLPPRAAFVSAVTEEVIDRALLIQEIADALNQPGEDNGIIIVGGRLSQFVDELCGNNFKVKIPFPKPKRGEDELLSGLDLIAAGAVFEQNAAVVVHEGFRNELRNAGLRLIETGIQRL